MPVKRVALRVLESAFALAVGTALIAITVFFVCHHHTTPVHDDWRILDAFFSRPPWQWILADHAGHRLPGTLLLLLLDYRWFEGRTHLLVGAALASLWLAVLALRSAWTPESWWRPGPALALAALCLFWAAGYFDLPWGTNHGTVTATFWLMLALACAVRYQPTRAVGGNHIPLVLAGAAAVAATFSQGMGIVAFPALMSIAIVGRFGQRVTLGYAAAAVVTLLVYRIGATHPLDAGVGGWSVRPGTMLLRIVGDTFAFIGATPASVRTGFDPTLTPETLATFATVTGGVALACALAFAIVIWRRQFSAPPRALLAVGLMAFAAGMGLLIAVVRGWAPGQTLSTRFALGQMTFWIGAIAAVSSAAAGRTHAWGLGAAIVLAMTLIPAAQQRMAEHLRDQERARAEALMHALGVRWAGGVSGTLLARSPERVFRVVDRLRRDHRSLFADDLDDVVGTSLVSRYGRTVRGPCGAPQPGVMPLVTPDGPAAVMFGRLPDSAPAFDLIVASDEGGVIRGLGVTLPHDTIEPAANTPGPPMFRWRGFVPVYRRTTRYAIFGVLPGGRGLCSFEEPRLTPGLRPGRRSATDPRRRPAKPRP